MGANEASPAAPSPGRPGRLLKAAAIAAAGALFIAFCPLLRIVPLEGGRGHAPAAAAAFDPAAAAARFWRTELPAAYGRAADLTEVARAVRSDPGRARVRFGKAAGLGAAYYFLRGRGRVVSREGNRLLLAPAGGGTELILIRLGPVFGDAVRDGCGLIDVNAFPGLEEYNAFSAQLNSLVERTVLPRLRAQAVVGATIDLVGCAQAPEDAPGPGQPVLTLVPVRARLLP